MTIMHAQMINCDLKGQLHALVPAVFPVTFWLIEECSDFFKNSAKSCKIYLCALNFASMHYLSMLKVIFL